LGTVTLFFTLHMGGQEFRTTQKKNCNHATYDEHFTFAVTDIASTIRIDAFDGDMFNSPEHFGSATVQIVDGFNQFVELKGKSKLNPLDHVTVRLKLEISVTDETVPPCPAPQADPPCVPTEETAVVDDCAPAEENTVVEEEAGPSIEAPAEVLPDDTNAEVSEQAPAEETNVEVVVEPLADEANVEVAAEEVVALSEEGNEVAVEEVVASSGEAPAEEPNAEVPAEEAAPSGDVAGEVLAEQVAIPVEEPVQVEAGEPDSDGEDSEDDGLGGDHLERKARRKLRRAKRREQHELEKAARQAEHAEQQAAKEARQAEHEERKAQKEDKKGKNHT